MRHYMLCTMALIAIFALCGVAAAGCGNPFAVSNVVFPLNPAGCVEMPRIPHTFGGCLMINGEPAPAGTVVCIYGTGVAGNCIEVSPGGCFGLGTFDAKLQATGISVPGGMVNVREGELLRFSTFVDGKEYPCRVQVGSNSLTFWPYHSGHHTVVTLSARVPVSCCGK